MLTIAAISHGASLTYPASSQVASILFLSIAIVGTLALTVVLLSTVGRNNSPSTLLVLSLCFADLLYCFSSVIVTAVNISAGGWALGDAGCIISNILVILSCYCSVLSLLSITLERYLSVIRQTILSRRTAIIWIASLWIVSTIIAFLPFMTGNLSDGIALQSAMLICATTWSSRSGPVVFEILLAIVVLLSCVLFMTFAYYCIVAQYIKTVRKLDKQSNSDIFNPSLSSSVFSTKSGGLSGSIQLRADEKKLMIKAIVISGSFTIMWTPYMLLIFYCLISGKDVSPLVDSICNCLGLLNSATNPILLFLLDSRIKRNVHSFFGDFFEPEQDLEQRISVISK
ncbi:hypothetical protein HDU91_007123 [Kappamyces sp. JEL0680]|nr:hypothetical protein HDU91_007123 [Kappamyces sp. JEL0680]